METYAANDDFPFSALVLGGPRPIQGGAHFTQASLGPGRPVYVQLPRCTLKQGIVSTKRACYCDLMYDKAQAEALITWLLALEGAAQDQIYKRRDTWFHNELSRDDVESMLTPMSRLYRAGRSLLIRASLRVDKATSRPKCTVYDEREAAIDVAALDPDATVIPLVLIDGIKFSARSFEIDVRLVQLMVLDPRPEPATACLIRHSPAGMDISPPAPAPELKPASAPEPQVATEPIASPVEREAPSPACAAPVEGAAQEQPCAESDSSPSRTQEQESEPEPEPARVLSPLPTEAPEPDPPAAGRGTPVHTDALGDYPPAESLRFDKDDSDDGSDDGSEASEVPEGLEEVHIGVDASSESMELRKPDDVYRDIYKAARRKARLMRRAAIDALLAAQKIKSQYMLDDVDDSDEDDEGESGAPSA